MYTLEERERAAYTAGDITLAAALAARLDLQSALGESLARILDLERERDHLKRILADALVDDSWRERAQAAIAD